MLLISDEAGKNCTVCTALHLELVQMYFMHTQTHKHKRTARMQTCTHAVYTFTGSMESCRTSCSLLLITHTHTHFFCLSLDSVHVGSWNIRFPVCVHSLYLQRHLCPSSVSTRQHCIGALYATLQGYGNQTTGGPCHQWE